MERITVSDLKRVLESINKETESNTGNYRLDGAYGGYTVYRNIDRDGTYCIDIFNCGHTSKRELYGLMKAFLEGIRIKGRY